LCIILLDFFCELWYNIGVNEREVFIMELECKGYIKRENKVFSFFKKYWVNVITVVLCVACCFVSVTQARGVQGEQGIQGIQGIQGERGERGADGANGKDGVDGKDGKDGVDGINGKDGINGTNGLNGKDGKDGVNGINGLDGKDGKDGTDGLTPHIGENGNWWIGNTDTGTKAQMTTNQIVYAYPDIHTLKSEDFILEVGRVYENVLFSHSGDWLRLYHKDGDTVIKTLSSASSPKDPSVHIGTIEIVGMNAGRYEFSFTNYMLLTDYIIQNYTN
jgi:hypothetical protein